MKRITLVVIILSVLVLAACAKAPATQAPGSTSTPKGIGFAVAPWKDGEVASYDWQDKKGNKVGTSELSYQKDGNAWVLSAVDAFPGQVDQTAKVRVDAGTLAPLGEEKTIKASGTDATINTTYQNGKLDIKAKANGKDQAATVDVPANAIDNDQLLATLRALPFAANYELKTVIVNGANATKVNATLRVLSQEEVTVPAGKINAWKVEMDFGQTKQSAWYAADAAHALVQYDNGSIVMVLTGVK
jgi:hypothetical protein